MTKISSSYLKYSLLAIIIMMGYLIIRHSMPYFTGVLGACTIYVLLRGQLKRLVNVKKMNKSLAATLLLFETLFICIAPAAIVIWVLTARIDKMHIDIMSIRDGILHLVNTLESKLKVDLFSSQDISKLGGFLTDFAQILIDQVGSFVINSLVLLFVLYFMFVGSEPMERYIYKILPISEKNKKIVIDRMDKLVKSNTISIPVLAIVQGFFATLGYFIFKTPTPLLFGFLTAFATILPVVGTMIVWLPVAIYMMIVGEIGLGIGLIIYGFLIVANSDNVTRFLLQRKLAKTHPLITVFGVLVGITIFGFWGIIIGPVFFSMFFLLFEIFRQQYIVSDVNSEFHEEHIDQTDDKNDGIKN